MTGLIAIKTVQILCTEIPADKLIQMVSFVKKEGNFFQNKLADRFRKIFLEFFDWFDLGSKLNFEKN